jgi:tRNA-2-methylthio-N6-dimethylallyladenosine synthase
MRRTYTVAQYEEVVGWARRWIPGVEITSDFIVGFPGETEVDFEATLALVERVGLVQAYCFQYSVRPRTPAARRLPDDVPDPVKRERNRRLLEVQDRVALERNRRLVGRRVEVLVEGTSRTDPTRVTGREPGNRIVHFEGGPELAGRLVVVEVVEARPHHLLGRAVAVEGPKPWPTRAAI